MAKPLHSHLFLHLLRRCSISPPPRFVHFTRRKLIPFTHHASPFSSSSFTDTPFPYQYEMIVSSPVDTPPARTRRRKPAALPNSQRGEPSESSELDFDEWVDKKLASKDNNGEPGMDKAKRKYYEKRKARMYGESDSEAEGGKGNESEFIELKQEVVELKSLHQRQEELYFYDAFAHPSEKNKHYKMVYQMEKKFFPNDGFDKAFLEPGQVNVSKGKKFASREKVEEDKRLVFFEESEKEQKEVKMEDVTEKKVGDFFKSLKKFPNENRDVAAAEPFFSSRSLGLPPKWDGPNGTVVLVNKPKGWTSFTVCGKLRRLVQVKKVGHAGTLDPMATGLLIVCVGKATKVVDSYQGMTKGYSGIFRLGEATSTWDADSPVIQREPWEHIKDLDIQKAAATFMGEISQVPPMFSAIKVNGQKMYDKARRGETVELAPRRISIFQFDVERSLDDRQNVLFRVKCSKGTYIRSLCADFGKSLGSCAHLTALRRDSIGEYSADDAWEFNELEDGITKGYV